MAVTIICPFHEAREELAVPASYSSNFSGELPCGAEVSRAILQVELQMGKVKKIALARLPANREVTL